MPHIYGHQMAKDIAETMRRYERAFMSEVNSDGKMPHDAWDSEDHWCEPPRIALRGDGYRVGWIWSQDGQCVFTYDYAEDKS